MTAALEVQEGNQALWVRAPRPASRGEESSSLANALVELCQSIDERHDRLACVILASGGESFWLGPPLCAADCDALGGEDWRGATEAVASLAPPTVAVIE